MRISSVGSSKPACTSRWGCQASGFHGLESASCGNLASEGVHVYGLPVPNRSGGEGRSQVVPTKFAVTAIVLAAFIGCGLGTAMTLLVAKHGPAGPSGEVGRRGPEGPPGDVGDVESRVEELETAADDLDSRLYELETSEIVTGGYDSRVNEVEDSLATLCSELSSSTVPAISDVALYGC